MPVGSALAVAVGGRAVAVGGGCGVAVREVRRADAQWNAHAESVALELDPILRVFRGRGAGSKKKKRAWFLVGRCRL